MLKTMKISPLRYTACSRVRARPLTLKEVLRLRDGMDIFRSQPYQIKSIANNEKILLALN